MDYLRKIGNMEFGTQHNTHIANDTDKDLQVVVEYSGKSARKTVKAHGSVCVGTDFRNFAPQSVGVSAGNSGVGGSVTPADYPGKVLVKVCTPSGLWEERWLRSDYSLLIKQRGSDYVLYQSTYGNIWEIDRGNAENKSLGF